MADIEQSRIRIKAGAGGATLITASVAGKAAGKKIAASLASKSAAKYAAKLGLSLSGKAVTSGTAVATAASMGAVCGPAAPACAVLGGITAAVLFEIALNEADEWVTRTNAKSDLKLTLLAMKNESENAYIDTYDQLIDDALRRLFRPGYKPIEN